MLKELEKEKIRNLHAQIYQRLRQLYLRITTGNREFTYAKVLREPSNSKDKWITFMAMLLESWQTQSYFPYTVELKLRDGEIYGSVSLEIPTPEVRYTKDTNASPIHLAIAEVSKTGELHQWNAKKFLQKIKRVAMLKGVEVVEVNPAYTSVIGMLKYAPQLSIDKDVAGAYVIGRRALGFKEDMPENYEKLLKDKTYLEFALKRYEEREKELRELLEEETNQYKRNALKSELRSVENARKLLTNLIQSLQSEPSGCEGANGRNSELASSEGSPPLPYPWKGLTKRPFSSEACVGGRGVG
jgi:hypothetical protein